MDTIGKTIEIKNSNVGGIYPINFETPSYIQNKNVNRLPKSNVKFPKYDLQNRSNPIVRIGESSTSPTGVKSSHVAPFHSPTMKSIYTGNNFWFEDPSVLFHSFDVVPNNNMTDAERLNAMTRIIIIIAAIMFIVKFPAWWIFLALGLIVVVVLWYIIKGREELYNDRIKRQTEYLRRPRKSIIEPISGNNQTFEINNYPLKLRSIL